MKYWYVCFRRKFIFHLKKKLIGIIIVMKAWQQHGLLRHPSPSLPLDIHPYQSTYLRSHLHSIQCPYRDDQCKFLRVGQQECLCVGVCRRTWLISSSLLLQLCLVCLVHEMRGKLLYSCCFVGCCFQDLFKTAPTCFFFRYFVRIQKVQL